MAMSREEHESSMKYILPRMGLARKTEEILEMKK